MKKEFTVLVKTIAYSKEEAQSKVDLLLQMGAFFKDVNVQNLAGSLIGHFLLAKVSQFTQGQVDLSHCYHPFEVKVNLLPVKVLKRKRRQYNYSQK